MDQMQLYYIITFYTSINISSFFLIGLDKYLARKSIRRVPEKWLFSLAIVGGALGIWLGMNYFRHKTKHMSFTLGIPLFLLVNLITLYGLMKYIF